MTTIVLADDHHLVRHALRALLEAEANFSIVGEEGDGLKVADLVERLRPDVLVVDVMMPGLNGLQIARQVHHRSPQTRVIMLSMHTNEAYVLEALRNGAAGYVLKDSSAQELVEAIHLVTAGRRFLSPPLSERAIEAYLREAAHSATDAYDTLTNREREVFQLLAESCSNNDVASRLSISPRTVETHRSNMMRKLDLHSRTDLIRLALKRGIIPIDS